MYNWHSKVEFKEEEEDEEEQKKMAKTEIYKYS